VLPFAEWEKCRSVRGGKTRTVGGSDTRRSGLECRRVRSTPTIGWLSGCNWPLRGEPWGVVKRASGGCGVGGCQRRGSVLKRALDASTKGRR